MHCCIISSQPSQNQLFRADAALTMEHTLQSVMEGQSWRPPQVKGIHVPLPQCIAGADWGDSNSLY